MLLYSGILMNITGSEWPIIILLALILILGTKRLPQLSRAMGKAIGEYEKARLTFKQEMENATKVKRDVGTSRLPRITAPVASEREKLETIATSLDIDYVGKSDEELRTLISQRMSA